MKPTLLSNFRAPLALLALVAVFLQAGSAGARHPTPLPADNDAVGGLKEALLKGVTKSVMELGRDGGFFENKRVRIPTPAPLRPVEKTLRFMRQGKLVDDFQLAMNHAAELAVKEALPVFKDAVQQMTISDAAGIVTGPKDSATQYFRRKTEARLTEKFLPIVKEATSRTGATAAYKNLLSRAGPLADVGDKNALDLDDYVTRKALDGLFLLIADEERNIRENPAARTTALLRKVFGGGSRR